MTEAELRQRFKEFRAEGSEPGLLAVALLVAACDRPAFEPGGVRARLAAVAFGARTYVAGHEHPRARVEGLCFYLKDVLGLQGDDEHYYEHDNSCIDRVLETGRGIPISLAVIYAEVGERLGMHCEGVNFPGHFLVRVRSDDDSEAASLIDPFAGRVISHAECEAFLQRIQGAEERLGPQHLQTASARTVLLRMLNNLKVAAISSGDYAAALRHSERIQLAEPTLTVEFRDRALIHEKLDDPDAAIAEWQGLLAALDEQDPGPAEGDRVRASIRTRIAALSGKVEGGRIVH